MIAMNEFRVVAEIGVWRGQFARKLPNWNKPYNVEQAEFDAIYDEAMGATAFASERRVVLRGTTLEVIDGIADGSVDFVYVDGDHTLRGVVVDLMKAWQKVREGGVVAGDDFSDSIWQHGEGFEPTLVNPFAIYFAEAMGAPLTLLPGGQYFIEKGRGAGFSITNLSGVELKGSVLMERVRTEVPRAGDSLVRKALRLPRRVAGVLLWRTSRRFREWRIERAQASGFPAWIAETGCLFIHIPKAAGTSVAHALYGRQIGHIPLREWESWYPRSIRRLEIFTIVREPVERFLSAFWFLKRGGMNAGDKAFADEYLAGYDDAERFVKALVDPGLQTMILKGMHFRPQHEFIEAESKGIRVGMIIPIERLDEGMARLEKRAGRAIAMPHLNRTERDRGEELSAEAKEILKLLYRKDAELHARALREFSEAGK
jgi:predicted O-methyltransferase YrrM